ncbi:MAG TPA: cytochrome c peroxidase, partial [Zeimonas sp.]
GGAGARASHEVLGAAGYGVGAAGQPAARRGDALIRLAALLVAGAGTLLSGAAFAQATTDRFAVPPAQRFVANAPGTYALPAIQRAGDGWVLEGSGFPRRLSRYTHGAVTLLSFVYTYCTDPVGCPLAHSVFVDVRERVRADPSLRGKVRFVSLSFDPAHDTPGAMQRFGAAVAHEREPRWHFLTTHSMRFLKPILDAWGQDVEVERDASGAPTRAITHLLKVFLVDPDGQVREIYGVGFLHPEVVFNDIRTVALEVPAKARAADAPLASAAPDAATPTDAPPLGLPSLRLPGDVVLDPARIALGRKLFFDRRLSANGTMSCAMCHVPEQAFASTASKRAVGLFGRSLPRNAPSLLDVAWRPALFHDGRESSLVAQAWQPLLHADEMGNASVDDVLGRLRSLPDYAGRFERAFTGTGATRSTVGQALAAFEASLVSAGSRFDRWRFARETGALSALEQRGFALFTGKARCSSCHRIDERFALFTDGGYHVTGAGSRSASARRIVVPLAPGVVAELDEADVATLRGEDPADPGRFAVTGDPADRDAFRTPMLRDVARSAPYMHDGSIATLEAVIDFYDRGGGSVAGKSVLLHPLGLHDDEKRALVAFLRTLDAGERFTRAPEAGR